MDNNGRINRIIGVIEKYGIPETDYQSSNFSVYYQQPYGDMQPSEGNYNVNNNIFVEIKNIDVIGNFIQDALNAGANQFYGLEYAISNPEPLLKEARKLAIEKALELGAETAGYAGLETGEVLSIEETPYYGGGPLYAAEMSAGRSSNGITTVPGEKKIEIRVTLKLKLK